MNRTILATASALALFAAGAVFAAESEVDQNGTGNQAIINQTGGGAATSSEVNQSGAGNLATVTQSADGATSVINQGGIPYRVETWISTEPQDSSNAEATVAQAAAAKATIDQVAVNGGAGRNVKATILQGEGADGSEADIYQLVSSSSNALIIQTGEDNEAQIRQYQGHHDSATFQTGEGNFSRISAGGSNTEQIVTQSGDDNRSEID